MSTRFRGELRYHKTNALLDNCSLEYVEKLSSIAGDTEPRCFGYATDFVTWEGPLADGTANNWLLSSVGTGTIVGAADDATGGAITLTTGATEDDNANLEFLGEAFRYTVGKRMWFSIRVKASDVDEVDLIFGLAIGADTDVFSTLPTDGIFFEKADAGTKMDFHVRQDGTSTEKTLVDSSALVDATYREYGFHVDVLGHFHVYVDGVEIPAAAVLASDANIPNDENLTLYIAIQTGEAAANTLDVDHVLIVQER